MLFAGVTVVWFAVARTPVVALPRTRYGADYQHRVSVGARHTRPDPRPVGLWRARHCLFRSDGPVRRRRPQRGQRGLGKHIAASKSIAAGPAAPQLATRRRGSAPGKATKPGSRASSKAPTGHTMADVAAHHTSSSCWVAIAGHVYDLTT